VIGKMLGPYEIVSSIGSGGMGQVYRAKDTRLGRSVAIKILNKEHMQRFEREARAIAALNYPHICQLYDIGSDYLVMEYVDGTAIKGPLSVEEAVRLAIQIAGALDEAHKRGILHRDLKPGNIMVTSGGSTKLLDFGLAKLSAGSESETASTMDGTVMGTPAYMSPEQAQGMPVDARSDIFSYGAVLYEIISGARAFEGTSTVEVLSAVLRDEPKPLQTLPQLERIVMRCLAKQPAQRYQTIAEVKAELEQISVKSAEQQPSIAVLPFVNMSGDKEQEYFSDGLAEEIINALAQIPGLKVIARTSAFAFRGKEQDITKIAEALRVRTILEGSVRKSGNRIRITAQLIDATDGSHLWSERYDRDMTDVFAIQDEISQVITRTLRVRLLGDRPLVKRTTENLEAFNLYLKGRNYLYKSTGVGDLAKQCFEQAIAIDPTYARPWYGLATLYYSLGAVGILPAKVAYAQCSQATLKALALDEMLPEAHSVLAALRAIEFDWEGAEREFRRALELGPGVSDIWMHYSGTYLVPMRRFDEAIAASQRSVELDPLNPFFHYHLGLRYHVARQYERSIEQHKNAIELEPNTLGSYLGLGLNFIQTGNLEEAVRVVDKFSQLPVFVPIFIASRGYIYARAGRLEDARKLLDELQKSSLQTYVPPTSFAVIHIGLGEIDLALDWLEKGVEEHDSLQAMIISAPIFDPIRSHPRYHALRRKMNLEP
jgi:eukaryotic-like serine/threonine-protein kinase